MRKTSGEFYPGYFKFNCTDEVINYDEVKFVPLIVIDDDGCHHAINDQTTNNFPTLGDLLKNVPMTSKLSFCLQDGTSINTELLTQGLVLNKNQEQFFFTQSYDELANDMAIVCIFTSSGKLIVGNRAEDDGCYNFDENQFNLSFEISKLSSMYRKCNIKKISDEKIWNSDLESGSLFIGGCLGPNDKYFPYGCYNSFGEFKPSNIELDKLFDNILLNLNNSESSAIASAKFHQIFPTNNLFEDENAVQPSAGASSGNDLVQSSSRSFVRTNSDVR